MDAILKSIIDHFKQMTPEEREKEHEKITHEKFYARWVQKINLLPMDRRATLINKCIKKYASKKYNERELNLGYEPRTSLFWLLYEYAKVYGKEIETSIKKTYFPTDKFEIDNQFLVEVVMGQGTFVSIKKIKKKK